MPKPAKVTKARMNAIRLCAPRERSPESMANPKRMRMGRASQPLSRSNTTEVKLLGASCTSLRRRDMRTMSPPMVVGRKLDVNCPAMKCENSLRKSSFRPMA